MSAGRPSLAVLKDALRFAESERASDEPLRDFLTAHAADERAGAKALLVRAERNLKARAHERERIAGLLALRDRLAADGVRGVAGVDEVGVGPLAGPVVAAAVVLPEEIDLPGLDDSKRVRPARRAELAQEIRAVALGVGIGEVDPFEIDQLGIYRAALESMRRAVVDLARATDVAHLLVDARTVPGIELPQTPIVKGDQKDASIAAASIVAKEYRDTHMKRLAERYPAYGFEQHMGYGTAAHLDALERQGPCPVHRRSFAPVEAAERKHAARPSAVR